MSEQPLPKTEKKAKADDVVVKAKVEAEDTEGSEGAGKAGAAGKAGTAAAAAGKVKGRKKVKRQITDGIAHIYSSFNNTIVTITDVQGNAIAWTSAANCGYRGSRKSTPYAATLAASEASKKALEMGVRRVSVFLKGPGSGRDAAVKALRTTGLHITTLADITKIPHNGCRPKNRRKG